MSLSSDSSVQIPVKAYAWNEYGPVKAVAFLPDGKHVVTGGYIDNSARLWNLESGVQDGEPLMSHTFPIISIAVSKSGTDIVTGGADNKVVLWKVLNRNAPRILFSGSTRVCAVTFNSPTSNSQTLVASSGSNGMVTIWNVTDDMDSALIRRIVVGDSRTTVTSIQFSPGYPNLIAAASVDKMTRIYDAHSREKKAELKGHNTTGVSCLAWFPGGQRIASCGGKSIRTWDPRTGEESGEPLLGHTSLVKVIAISPDGRFIASGSRDGSTRLWNAVTRKQIGNAIFHPVTGAQNVQGIGILTFSPDGKSLLSVTDDGKVYLWDMDYLEVEEGLQNARVVVNELVSSTSAMRIEFRDALEYELEAVRREHARELSDLRNVIEEKKIVDERRFNELQDALYEVRQTQDFQLETLREALNDISLKQETEFPVLENAIANVLQRHKGHFDNLRDAQTETRQMVEDKHKEIQTDLKAIQKVITEMGVYIKKTLPPLKN